MNGSSALNYPTNEQLIGKFHVTNVDKIPVNNHPEDIIPQTVTIPDESGCASRFQMIRVDRNFGNGRWKVHDYEPPENTSISTIPSVNTIENESINVCNDPNITTSAATAFQQQRMTLNSTPAVVPTAANVPPPPPTGFLHGYPPSALTNQSYLLSNHPPHPQFGYYHFYPPPYSHYAPPWATPAALAAANPYLQPPTTSLLSSTANHNDPLRLSDTDNNGENTYPNPTIDPLQNAQFAAYLYALQHSHSQYIPQTSSTAPSYATIPSYHPLPPPHPTILPLQNLPNSTTDIQQSHQPSILTSPKHEGPKSLLQQSSLITPKTKPSVTTVSNGISNDSTKSIDVHDLISSSPALTTAPPTLISPINISTTNVPTTSLNNIWSYTTAGSPLNLIQTTQTAAVTEMNLSNNEPSQNIEIAHDILKELTTPTKQNNTTDIDNKISAAMDLVKMHLLSAVREEVTELRQQIRTLNEKLNGLEHENAFLRPHVPSEIYAQYIPPIVALSSSNDSTNSTTNTVTSISSVSSSQPVPMTSLSTIPSVLAQQTTLSTNQPPSSLSTTNLPLT